MDNIPKLLKGFVIVGGLVLIAGTALLVALIVLRASGERTAEAPPVRPQTVVGTHCTGGPPPQQPRSVPMPAGARVDQVVPDGNCLILLGTDGDGRQFVALVDPLTGEVISLLHIQPDS